MIGVVNAGSSTLKCALFDYPLTSSEPIWKGLLEKRKDTFWITINGKSEQSPSQAFPKAAHQLLSLAFGNRKIAAIGHRVVHGGEIFIHPTEINAKILLKLKKISHLAPLHNPVNLQGIHWAQELFPGVPHVAVFDTAFHHTMDQKHYLYPVPLAWKKKGIRRYGFHGISHQSCYEHLNAVKKGKAVRDLVVTCHLGNGCSLAAIKKGRSMDTTMGFTPMEGLVMGTRCGSLDPGIIFHVIREKYYTPDQLESILNHESGLKALAGTNDMREILERKNQGDSQAILAFEMYCLSCAKWIAAMAASLEGLSILVFTGGIGENAHAIRHRVLESLRFLGIRFSPRKNRTLKSEGMISLPSSEVEVYVFKAREEWQIAKEAFSLTER